MGHRLTQMKHRLQKRSWNFLSMQFLKAMQLFRRLHEWAYDKKLAAMSQEADAVFARQLNDAKRRGIICGNPCSSVAEISWPAK